MKPYAVVGTSVLLAGLFGSVLFAQKAKSLVHIEKVMTPEELRATGVASLSPAQRAALDEWLYKYTVRVLKLASISRLRGGTPGNVADTYAGIGSGHWIAANDSHGAIITLEDGSMWQINPVDQVDTWLWLPVTNITVVQAKSSVGDYRHVLINSDDNEKALAKYLGTQ